MKKIRHLGLAAALAGSLALTACGGDSEGSAGDGAVTVGWIGQQTGSQAIFGEQSTNAIKLALEEIEAEGGPEINVVYEDNEADPGKSVTAFQSMMSENPVTVITGGSSVVIALAPLAEQNDITIANVAAQSPELVTDQYPSVYNFLPTGKAEAEALAQKIYEDGIRKVATEMVDADYGIDTTEAFTAAFEELGGEVVAAERHEFAGTDMRAQLRKIKETDAEAVVICASEAEVGYVAAQAKELTVGKPLYGYSYALSPTNYEIAGDAMTGMKGVAVSFTPESGAGQEFAEKYKEKYGEDAILYGAISYQTMKMIAAGVEEVGNDPAALEEYMSSIQDFEGVMGTTTMGEDRQVELPLTFWEISDSDQVGEWN